MAVQLQPAEIELRIVTDEAERQLAAFREKLTMEGEVGDFQAGEGAVVPEKMAKRLQAQEEAKTEEQGKSWGQRAGYDLGPTPPRIHTEIAAWAREVAVKGLEFSHSRRVVETAGNLAQSMSKTLEEGRLTAITDRIMLSAGPWLADKGGLDDRNARRIVTATRIAIEAAYIGIVYGPTGSKSNRKALENRLKPIGEWKDENGVEHYDADFVKGAADEVEGGLREMTRESIINTEAAMKATMQTLSQLTNMGVAMARGGLGEQMVGIDEYGLLNEIGRSSWDFNKMQEKMRREAEIEGTRYFVDRVSANLLDRIGYKGQQLE